MHTRIDRWTQLLAQTALAELEASPGNRDPHLVGGVLQRVREVLGVELANNNGASPDPGNLARQLALTIYLTTAVEGSQRELGPSLLGSLTDSLERTLVTLGREAPSPTLRGGAV